MNKLNVVISAIWYPCTMAQWFVRAFQRRDDVNLIRVGPFTQNWIPWSKPDTDPRAGMFLPMKYVDPPEVALPQSMIGVHMHPQMLRDKLPQDVDLWIEADSGWHFSARPPCKIHALLKTDPHVLGEWYQSIDNRVDYVFSMQEFYLKPNEIYIPYAYDPTVHFPEQREKKYDVCLVGLLYPQRARLINKLREDGLSVFYDIGLVYSEYREVYNESRISLSWSTLNDLPARVWEGMAMGLPVVTNRIPDLKNFFKEDWDYLGFDTLEEAEQKILGLIENVPQQMYIGGHGRDTVKPHTYDLRCQTILESCGLL